MSIIATSIVTAFGAYYLEEGQNMDRLKDALRQKSVTPEACVSIITESDMYRSANVALGEIVQSFQKGCQNSLHRALFGSLPLSWAEN